MEQQNSVSGKKKILILVDWFAPGYKAGGPIQSCVNVAVALKNDFEIYVLTTDTDHGETEPYPNTPSNQWTTVIDPNIKVYYVKKKTLSTAQIKAVITNLHPDFVYLNHLFSPYFVVYPLWLKCTGTIKSTVVLCPRGGLYDSALAVKTYKKKPFLWLFKCFQIHKRIRFHATNEREKKAIELYFPGSTICIVDNLPNLNQPVFRSCEKQQGTIRCIFIARIVAIKNLLFLLSVLEKTKAVVQLTVIGFIEDKNYWNECEKKINQLPENIKVIYAGTKKNSELLSIIQQHHLFILPTTGENFGHSIFEALLAGRPILISNQTPWLNLQEKKIGWDLPLHQPEAFIQAIETAASWNQQSFDAYANTAWLFAQKFISNPDIKQQYLKLFS